MPRSSRSYVRMLACERGSTMVGYSSLALLVAIAAIILFGYPDIEAGGPPQRAVGTVSSD